MEHDKAQENQQLFPAVSAIVSNLEKEAYNYLNKINTEENNIFLDTEEFIKKYKKEYHSFSVTLEKSIGELEKNILLLTALIKKSDEECDSEKTQELSEEFEKYLRFSEGVADFIEQNEKKISEKNFIKANIIACAQKLLSVIINYKKNIRPI